MMCVHIQDRLSVPSTAAESDASDVGDPTDPIALIDRVRLDFDPRSLITLRGERIHMIGGDLHAEGLKVEDCKLKGDPR